MRIKRDEGARPESARAPSSLSCLDRRCGVEPIAETRRYQSRGCLVPEVVIAYSASLGNEGRDWPQIAALYGQLVRLTGSAVVELNRAIAVAEADGTEAGLALVDRLDLDGYQYFHSTRADLLRRLGRADAARTEYERALALAHTEPERRFLRQRVAEVGA